MIIVHVVEAWKGGIASYIKNLIAAQLNSGYKVFLFADERQFQSDIRDIGVEVIFYKTSRNPFKLFSIAKNLSVKLMAMNADIVHCHSTFPGVYCRVFRNKSKSRLIYTPHGWSFFKEDINFLVRKIYGFIEKYLSYRCNAVMCMSFEELEAAEKLGISKDKLAMIHTGIFDIDYNKESSPSGSGSIRIGFFGRLDYQKGYDYLERAVPYLSGDVELHFFGDAVRGSSKLISAKNVVNHGWVSHEEMHSWMLGMDAVISPSRWEGFSLTVLEAMRAGKALVISDKTSLPEVVISGFNGIILYDLSPEALAKSLNNLTRDECQRMGLNSRKIFEECFTFEKYYRRVQVLYRGN